MRVSEVSERTNKRSRVRERIEEGGASERVIGSSEQANGQASGPVLTSLLADSWLILYYIYIHGIHICIFMADTV